MSERTKRNNKKGQVSLFVILGLAILIAVAIIIFISNKNKDAESEVVKTLKDNEEGKAINYFVSTCLEKSAKKAFLTTILQGGYSELPENSEIIFSNNLNPLVSPSLQMEITAAPYYILEGKIILPSVEEINGQLALGIEQPFFECIDNFSSMNYTNIEYNDEAFLAQASINQKAISFKITLPVKINQKGNSIDLNDFSHEIDYNFLEKYLIVKDYVNEQAKDTYYFNIGYLGKLAEKNKFKFTTTDVPETNALHIRLSFEDGKQKLGEPLEYGFLVKYT